MTDPSPTLESTRSADGVPGATYQPGDVVAGKYTLESLLGQGGMGSVFRARNTAIDLPVAIKLLRADLNGATFRDRLLQEARAAARLQHPAVARVFDVGQTANGDPFIVMELLEGETLAKLLHRVVRLSPQEAVGLLLPIAEGLTAVHAAGFVHRDVKPDNIFIAECDGRLQPKLVDFGIVKLDSFSQEGRLTQVGAVLGSPEYMSPEQAQGLEEVDLRSDVWSFSVALYEAITGRSPFASANYQALLRTIIEQEPPRLTGQGIAELGALVARGMSKSPEARFSSMTEYGRALAEWLAAQGRTSDACGVSLDAHWLDRTEEVPVSPRGSSPIAAVSERFHRHPTTSVSPVARSAPPSARYSLGTTISVAAVIGLLFGLGFASAPHFISTSALNLPHATSQGIGVGLVVTQTAAANLPERIARPTVATLSAVADTAPAPAPMPTFAAAVSPTAKTAINLRASKAAAASSGTPKRFDKSIWHRSATKPGSELVRSNPYIDLMAPY